jgi:hypothetical protein
MTHHVQTVAQDRLGTSNLADEPFARVSLSSVCLGVSFMGPWAKPCLPPFLQVYGGCNATASAATARRAATAEVYSKERCGQIFALLDCLSISLKQLSNMEPPQEACRKLRMQSIIHALR